jgi:hypothetical protein
MKYTGMSYEWCGDEVWERSINGAILTANRISIGWEEDGEQGHLKADVVDHAYFRGYYGYPQPDPNLTFDLRKYESGDRVILFGTWTDRGEPQQGKWLFVLWPTGDDA